MSGICEDKNAVSAREPRRSSGTLAMLCCIVLSAAGTGCAAAAPPGKLSARGPSVRALPDPCSVISFGLARQLVPGLTRRDISHDGQPDTGQNTIPGNTECIWGIGPPVQTEQRDLMIALQLFSTTSAGTGVVKAHMYLTVFGASRGQQPLGGLGEEARIGYHAATRMGFGDVIFRLGNMVADIRYTVSRPGGSASAPIGSKAATGAALTVAEEVLEWFQHHST
jgi:hypothetical protein